MFLDTTGTVSISLPPAWAFDPRFSSLTKLCFRDWREPCIRKIFVVVGQCELPPSCSDEMWESVVREQLRPSATDIERLSGPALLAQLKPCTEGRCVRVVRIRGPRLDTVIEQHGETPGSSLLTSELAEAMRTVHVPANYRITEDQPQTEYNQAMHEGVSAAKLGDRNGAVGHLQHAELIANRRWIHSLVTLPLPDLCAIEAAVTAALEQVRVKRASKVLHYATTTLYRARNSQLQAQFFGTSTVVRMNELINEALDLHSELNNGVRPTNCGDAAYVRKRLLLAELIELYGNGLLRPDVPWEDASELASLAMDNALTSMMLFNVAEKCAYNSLSDEIKAMYAQAGVFDDVSMRVQHHNEEIQCLDALVDAGVVISSVELGAVSISACAMRENALVVARELVRLAPSQERYLKLVQILSGYAAALSELGDEPSLDQAKALLTEARDILDCLEDNDRLRAQICTNQAVLHWLRNEYQEGLFVVARAIALARVAGDQRTESMARSCRSRLLSRVEKDPEALAEAKRALDVARGNASSSVRESLAISYHRNGYFEEAAAEIRECLATSIRHNPIGSGLENPLVTASIILERHNPDESLKAKSAAEIVYNLSRQDIGGAAEQVAFSDAVGHRELGARLLERCLNEQDYTRALVIADRYRARSLVESVGFLTRIHSAVEVRYPPADAPLFQQIESIERNGKKALETWGVPLPLDKNGIIQLIAEHERTVILFHPSGDQLFIFVAKPEGSVIFKNARIPFHEIVDITNTLHHRLGAQVAALAQQGKLPSQIVEGIQAACPNEQFTELNKELARLERKLHDALFSEVLSYLRPEEALVIIPYRELSVVPFSVLTGCDGIPLIERHPISIMPSIASLGALSRPQAERCHAVVVGDPLLQPSLNLPQLAGAKKEAGDISKALRAVKVETVFLPGEEATEPKFREAAKQARILHMACHATVREPASASCLFLTRSVHDDGLLLPAEIAHLQLDGALVVLSACQTGLGRATADGVLGLSRAFLHAGARCLVLSLWRVADTVTAELMCEFYAGLLGTAPDVREPLDVAGALRRAQLNSRQALSDSSSWAPWFVLGDGGWSLRKSLRELSQTAVASSAL